VYAPARAPDAADDRPRRQREFDQIGAAPGGDLAPV